MFVLLVKSIMLVLCSYINWIVGGWNKKEIGNTSFWELIKCVLPVIVYHPFFHTNHLIFQFLYLEREVQMCCLY